MIGSLKTLFDTLTLAPTLKGVVNVAFGEEMLNAEELPTPLVVIVPIGGSWSQPGDAPGYFQAADANLNNVWMTQEAINIHCWAQDPSPDALPVDHASACEELRAAVLRALQFQCPDGLKFFPVSGQWIPMQNAVNRFGRGYILTVQCDVTVPDVPVEYATIETVTIQQSFEE